jgi:hypothetical protein
VQEKNPFKAINSFALMDIIDGVDSPLIVLQASVGLLAEVGYLFGLSVSKTGLYTTADNYAREGLNRTISHTNIFFLLLCSLVLEVALMLVLK